MRAIEPVQAGFVERNGARIGYEVFGEPGRPTLLLMPTFAIVHSRIWKMQVPYLARHYRVLTWDGVGNGRSDRPAERERYTAHEHAADAVAVLDAADADRAVVLAASMGTHRSLQLAAQHPDRVEALVLIGPQTPLGSPPAEQVSTAFLSGDRDAFAEAFMRAVFNEPHSSKAVEDGRAWAAETSMPVLFNAYLNDQPSAEQFRQVAGRVACPVLVVTGDQDLVTPEDHARGLVDAVGDNASLLVIEGGGHTPSCATACGCPWWCARWSSGCIRGRCPRSAAGRGRSGVRGARCSSPLPSDSATPAGTSRSPASCAPSTRTSRSTGWPPIP